MSKKDIITIDDLSNEEIENIFRLADVFLSQMALPGTQHRITGRLPLASEFNFKSAPQPRQLLPAFAQLGPSENRDPRELERWQIRIAVIDTAVRGQ